jgi:predicted GNAT family N-acyltransferase
VAKAERVAVLEAARGTGLGTLLMSALECEARRLGYREVVLNAQIQVLPFYFGLGYVAEGPQFDEAGIQHRKMRKAI